MSKFINIAEARAKFPQVIKRVMDGERVIVGRYGTPVAVLLSHEQYEEMLEDIEDLRTALEAEIELRKNGGIGVPIDEATPTPVHP